MKRQMNQQIGCIVILHIGSGLHIYQKKYDLILARLGKGSNWKSLVGLG